MKSLAIIALIGTYSSVQAVTITRPFKLGEDTIDFDEDSEPIKDEPVKLQTSFSSLV